MNDTGMSETEANSQKKTVFSDQNRILVILTARVVTVIAVCLSLYQLYTAGVVALTALVQRSIHLGAILSLVFLLKPPFSGAKKIGGPSGCWRTGVWWPCRFTARFISAAI